MNYCPNCGYKLVEEEDYHTKKKRLAKKDKEFTCKADLTNDEPCTCGNDEVYDI